MNIGRRAFGPALIAWTDAAASDLDPVRVLAPFGPTQARRFASVRGVHAQRFVAGRWLLAQLITELTDVAVWGFTTNCERCGAVQHGRPRLEAAPVAVSISYAGNVVAAAAVDKADAAAVGVDIERIPGGGSDTALEGLARLFSPAPAPDLEGWTLIEAALKADGRGVTVDLPQVCVGEIGTGRMPGSRAVRVPGRDESIDAAVIPGPNGFVLSAAIVPGVGRRHPV